MRGWARNITLKMEAIHSSEIFIIITQKTTIDIITAARILNLSERLLLAVQEGLCSIELLYKFVVFLIKTIIRVKFLKVPMEQRNSGLHGQLVRRD
jgi:hypothetical protein